MVIWVRCGSVLRGLARKLWNRHRWSLPLSIGSAIFFARLASEMREGEVDAFDQAIERTVDGARGHVDGLMLALTKGGDILPMSVLTASLVAALLARGRRRESGYLALGAGGGLLLNMLLKAAFRRARPGEELVFLLPSLSSFSFPSGHTMGTTAVIGSVLVILRVMRARPAILWAAFLFGGAIIVGVGLSRIYLGAHYPSDVLGGFLAAAAWVSAVTGWMYPRVLPGEDERRQPRMQG